MDKPDNLMFVSNPAGSKYSEDLVFAPSDLKSDKVLVSGVITREDQSELTKLSKKAKIVDIDKKEEEQRMAVIKAKHVQEVCKPDLPDIQTQAAVTTTPEPADIDAMIAEMEAAARDARTILKLTEDHRDAAVQVIRTLGEERAAEIVKAIHQQLKRELAAIWRREEM
jgi:hypothetical protein